MGVVREAHTRSSSMRECEKDKEIQWLEDQKFKLISSRVTKEELISQLREKDQ